MMREWPLYIASSWMNLLGHPLRCTSQYISPIAVHQFYIGGRKTSFKHQSLQLLKCEAMSVRKTSFKQLLNWTRLLMSTLPIAGLSALNPPAAPRPTVWISSCNFSLISSLSPKLSLKIPALAIPPIQISSSYDFLGFAITERKTWLSSEHS